MQSYGKACSGDCIFLPVPMLQRLAGTKNSLYFYMHVLAGLKVNLDSLFFFNNQLLCRPSDPCSAADLPCTALPIGCLRTRALGERGNHKGWAVQCSPRSTECNAACVTLAMAITSCLFSSTQFPCFSQHFACPSNCFWNKNARNLGSLCYHPEPVAACAALGTPRQAPGIS